MSHRAFPLFAFFVVGLLLASWSFAEIPQMMSYQGKVTDSGGSPVADGTYTMRFRVYDAATGGTMLWDSGSRSIQVSGGVFNVLLGESPQPSLSLDFDTDYWLQVTFLGTNQTPRHRLGSVGYAYMASGLVSGTEVSGSAAGSSNAVISAINTSTDAETHGLQGISLSTWYGAGVFAAATSTTGATYGIYATNESGNGTAVYGLATHSSGSNYGGRFETPSIYGKGVWGKAGASSGSTYGGFFTSNSPDGIGVHGRVYAATGETRGVYGQVSSSDGRGVYGSAIATTGATYGGYFVASSTGGVGVYGNASATSGAAYGGYFTSSSPSGWAGGFSGNVYVSGIVGIGTTSPDYQLDVRGDRIRLRESGTNHWIAMRTDGSLLDIEFEGAHLVMQSTTDGENIVLNPTTVSNVGIRTWSPGYPLDVAGSAHASSFPTSSDERLKQDITQLRGALEKIERIRGVSFNWNELYESMGRSTGHREIGVIAQEVEAVFPELVTKWGDENYRAVDYGRLTAVLIEAVRELKNENDALKARVELLEASM
jgi:hypothetical protein